MLTPTYVVSSNINCAAFEGDKLYIRFRSGAVYSYDGASYGVFDSLVRAESVGQFFHRFIRGKYPYTKLEHDPFCVAMTATPFEKHEEAA